MHSNILNTLLNCIIEEAKIFLTNDMQIDIVEIKTIPNYILENTLSSINLIGTQTFTVIVSIQEELVNDILYKLIPDGLKNSEKDEMMNDLINETANTIVGLSIRNFPSKYKDLELSIASIISQNEALALLQNNNHQNLQIITNVGILSCTIVEASCIRSQKN